MISLVGSSYSSVYAYCGLDVSLLFISFANSCMGAFVNSNETSVTGTAIVPIIILGISLIFFALFLFLKCVVRYKR